MSALHRSIAALAEKFAASVVEALTKAPVRDLTSLGNGASASRRRVLERPAIPPPARNATTTTRLPRTRKGARRSLGDQQKIVDAIVTALASNSEGLSNEQLQKALGLAKKDLQRPIALALTNRTIKKKGIKRATRYFVA